MPPQQVARTKLEDQDFAEDSTDENFQHHLLLRVSAKNRTFRRVNFSHARFSDCYFRYCTFEDCQFVGAKFSESGFPGSTFEGCDFKYTSFSRTRIPSEVLTVAPPSWPNVRRQFARELRKNFESLGDVDGVNLAIQVELEATKKHLFEAFWDQQGYHRRRYKGLVRFQKALEYL